MPKIIKEADVPGMDRMPPALTANRYYVYCPACHANAKKTEPDASETHWMRRAIHCIESGATSCAMKPEWSFDGNFEAPTLSPSLLVRSYHGEQQTPYVCHSFVKAGKIQYLGDCTHSMAGQTVDLMDVPSPPVG